MISYHLAPPWDPTTLISSRCTLLPISPQFANSTSSYYHSSPSHPLKQPSLSPVQIFEPSGKNHPKTTMRGSSLIGTLNTSATGMLNIMESSKLVANNGLVKNVAKAKAFLEQHTLIAINNNYTPAVDPVLIVTITQTVLVGQSGLWLVLSEVTVDYGWLLPGSK